MDGTLMLIFFGLISQVICYERGQFLFVFNFHPENSYENYIVGVEEGGEYQVRL